MRAICILFCTDKLVLQLSQELKRLQRRKAMTSGEGSSSQSSSGSGNGPGSPGNSKEQPLFTLKQVSNPGMPMWPVDLSCSHRNVNPLHMCCYLIEVIRGLSEIIQY